MFSKEQSLALKGIAIIMMLFHHCFRSFSLFEAYDVSFFPFSDNAVVGLAFAGKTCVSIFAFISGYGLYFSYKGKKELSASKWVTCRYIKTLSGFWLVYIMIAIANIVVDNRFAKVYFTDHNSFEGITNVILDFMGVSHLFKTGTLITTWWYMSAAVSFIILMPFVSRLVDEYDWLVVLFIVGFLRVILIRINEGAFTGSNSIYSFIPIFVSGSIFAKNDLFNKIMSLSKKYIQILVELILIVILYQFYSKLPQNIYGEFHFTLFPIIFIVLCVELIQGCGMITKILQFFGKHSLNIYLIHSFIRTGYLERLTYSFKHFILILCFLLFSSLLFSVLVEMIKKVVKYDSIIEEMIDRMKK